MTRGRNNLTPQDLATLKEISRNIRRLLAENKTSMSKLSRELDIPLSTISGYVRGVSLPVAGNVQKIADYFGLKKSDIDPRFKTLVNNVQTITNSDNASISTETNQNHTTTNNFFAEDCGAETKTDLGGIINALSSLDKDELDVLISYAKIVLKKK